MMENDDILVSVICVVLNEQMRIRTTLDSLAAGLSDATEVVFVDGGSTDKTVEEIEKYAALRPNSRLLRQKSKGLYAAMNEGSIAATGEFLYFLNAGDRLMPSGALVKSARLMAESGSHLGLAAVFHETADRIIGPTSFELELFLRGRVDYNHQGTIFRRSALLRLGGYNSRYGIMADFALMASIANEKSPQVLHDVLAYYEGGGISESRSLEIPYIMHDVRRDVVGLYGIRRLISYSFAVAQGFRRHGLQSLSVMTSRRSKSV